MFTASTSSSVVRAMSLSGGATASTAVAEPIEYFRKDYAPSGYYSHITCSIHTHYLLI